MNQGIGIKPMFTKKYKIGLDQAGFEVYLYLDDFGIINLIKNEINICYNIFKINDIEYRVNNKKE